MDAFWKKQILKGTDATTALVWLYGEFDASLSTI
jgi:hypothetical protein